MSGTGVAIGLDVGGTKIAAGLVESAGGRILSRRSIATGYARGGAAVLDDTVALAGELRDEAVHLGRQLLAVGVGVPQLVDGAGRIVSAYNFDWTDLPVRDRLARLAPTAIESDVRAAALAEARAGAGQGGRPFVYVTIGTGISYCLVIDGRPFAGANGCAIHFASSALLVHCQACGSVARPLLEDIASGPAMAAAYARRIGRDSAVAEAVFAAAASGDAAAVEIVTAAADQLGALVGLVVNMLDPARLVLGGGIGLAGGLYRRRLEASTRAHIWAESCRGLPILSAAFGADAGVVGAAFAALPAMAGSPPSSG